MIESDGFLARWARRKAQAQDGVLLPDEAAAAPLPPLPLPSTPDLSLSTPDLSMPDRARPAMPPAVDASSGGAAAPGVPAAPAAGAPLAPLPTMDDVALLTRHSDYSRFVTPGVDRGVSNAAMKKLFADPHFNVMDGLDTYIDDYGIPDPIPESMLRKMVQAKFLGLFDDEEEEAPAALAATTDGAAPPPLSQSGAAIPDAPAAEPEDPVP